MNFNTIIFYDFETTSVNPKKTQPTQLSAVAIHPRKLEILPNGIFNSYIKPEFNEEKQKKFGLDGVEEEALKITGISVETLEKAPVLSVVWTQFVSFIEQFNPKKTKWNAPIAAGYNNNKFDDIIIERICGGNELYNIVEREPYKLGPWDDDRSQQKLFHPRDNIDLMKEIWGWFENDINIKSISFDKMREKFGMSDEYAHNSKFDTLQGALLLVKFLKLRRYVHNKMGTKFDNSFNDENKVVAKLMNQGK